MRKLSHQTRLAQQNDFPAQTDYDVGDRVMADGYPGQVTAVHDAPWGASSYEVKLDNDFGGGDYPGGQIYPMENKQAKRGIEFDDLSAPQELTAEATTTLTANHFYPELGDILDERPPNERVRVYARKVSKSQTELDEDAFDTGHRHGYQHAASGGTNPDDDTDDQAQHFANSWFSRDNSDQAFHGWQHGYATWHNEEHAGLPHRGGAFVMADTDGAEDDADQFPSTSAERNPEPDTCSWCGAQAFTDPQDTGRGTRMRCAQCGGTMALTDHGIGWQPEFPNSSQNAASGQGDPRATINDLRAVHSSLNVPASAEAGYPIFTGLAVEANIDAGFEFTATWADVQRKAANLRSEGRVRVLQATASGAVGEVNGETALYETEFHFVPGTRKIAYWDCGCKWGAWANVERTAPYKRFQHRACSHNLALRWQVQSKGAHGREVTPDVGRLPGQYQRTPVQVQYQLPTERYPEGRDLRRRTVPPANMKRQFASLHQASGLTPAHEWARCTMAAGVQPSAVFAALRTTGMAHEAARDVITYASASEDASAVLVDGALAFLFDVNPETDVATLTDGRMVRTESIRFVAKDKEEDEEEEDEPGEATADPSMGAADPGTDIPRLDDRDQTDLKGSEDRHILHHTNDTRKHAPNFGYGLPWGGTYDWCPQCNGSGCGHCGGSGQVSIDQPPQNSPGPGEVSLTNSPIADQNPDAGGEIYGDGDGLGTGASLHTATYSNNDTLGGGGTRDPYRAPTPHATTDNPGSQGWGTSADPKGWVAPVIGNDFGEHWASLSTEAAGDGSEAPTHAGVALKAADSGRVLMIQRSNSDKEDANRGKWEFPGGGIEKGDQTSLHAGVREFEEETGQKFPEGGHLTHVHRNQNYVLHTVVVPSESDVGFKDGRSTVNPDDPDGDDHEQSAWWEVDHAKKNPALRDVVKSTPWNELSKAAGLTATRKYRTDRNGESNWTNHCEGPGCRKTISRDNYDMSDWSSELDNDEVHHEFCSPEHALAHMDKHPQMWHQTGEDYDHPEQNTIHDVYRRMVHGKTAVLNDPDEPEGALPWTEGTDESPDADTTEQIDTPNQLGPDNDRVPPGIDTQRDTAWGYPEEAGAGYQPPDSLADVYNQEPVTADEMPPIVSESARNEEMAMAAAANPILEEFWKTAGGAALVSGREAPAGAQSARQEAMAGAQGARAGKEFSDGDIAATARRVLAGLEKTGAKDFSYAEQQELINEGAGGGKARNFGDLKIAGTHYEHVPEDMPDDEPVFFL